MMWSPRMRMNLKRAIILMRKSLKRVIILKRKNPMRTPKSNFFS